MSGIKIKRSQHMYANNAKGFFKLIQMQLYCQFTKIKFAKKLNARI